MYWFQNSLIQFPTEYPSKLQTMKIYHVKGTRSIRVIWLCAELDVALEIETLECFDADFKASPAWRSKSPTGKVPVLDDDGLTIYESGAIVQYILEKYGPGGLTVQAGTVESAMYHQWSWFAEATFARPLGDIAHHTRIKPPAERIPAVVEDAKKRALLCLDAVDKHMKNNDYLVDNRFTAADIMMGYTLVLARSSDVLRDAHPTAESYLERLLERPAMQYALAA